MGSKDANVPEAGHASKTGRVPATLSFPSEGDLRVIDTAAAVVGKTRSAYVADHAISKAESDLRDRDIDPDAVRRAA